MSNFSFENQGSSTYLVYTVGADEEVDAMTLGMLTNNKIPGLSPSIFTQIDTTKMIKYNVTSKVAASQFFSGVVNRKKLLGIFNGIVDAMLSADDYMIDPASILVDLDRIFVDVTTYNTVLICLPVVSGEPATNLGLFFKNIMFSTQFDQNENCDYIARVMNFLNSSPVLVLSEFKKVLEELENGAPQSVAPVQPARPIEPAVSTVAPTPVPAVEPVSTPVVPPQPKVDPVPTPVAPTIPQPVQQFAIPNVPEQPITEEKTEKTKEKGMSLIYLMQHYNKENAAIYKAQKEAAKEAEVLTPKAPKPEKPAKAEKPVAAPSGSFGFAIPGQAAPAPAPTPIPTPAPTATPVQVPPVPQKPAAQSVAPQPQVNIPPVQPLYQQQVNPQAQAYTAQGGMNFGETIMLGAESSGETVILDFEPQAAPQVMPYLVRKSTSEKIMLDKPIFRLGKERSFVDYCISDSPVVSRSHANVVSRDGKFFIVDTNSKNHTFINGQMIPSNVEVEITNGTSFVLAREEFTFYTM